MFGLFSDLFRGKNWINELPQGKHKLSRYHWYNMVAPSPWPLLLSMNTLPMVLGGVGCLQGINDCLEMLIIGFISFLFFFALWNRDIVRESTFMGVHTKQVDSNTIMGFKLFLFTETMLFVSFFWAYLYSALYPSVFIGLSWPPVGLADLLLDPFDIPLTNTVILIYSGFTVTLSHLYLRRGSIFMSAIAMLVTIVFGLAFLYIQYSEYTHAEFDISDGIYGSTFYMLTGFHGGHVIIGVSALIITLIRLIELHFSSYSHTGFKLALIYWHFVDVVWIFVFLIVYVLGSDLTYPDIVYYTNSNAMGCIVNIDQAFFGKWWKGFPVSRDEFDWFANHRASNRRINWINFTSQERLKELIHSDISFIKQVGNGFSTAQWFTTKNISLYTTGEKTKLYYDSLVNDQSTLSRKQSINVASEFKEVCALQAKDYKTYHNSYKWRVFEMKAQKYVVNAWNQQLTMKKALNSFYVVKLLPSALNDANDLENGLNNFCGKMVIYSETLKRVEGLNPGDFLKNESSKNLIWGIWKHFVPATLDSFFPYYVRVMLMEVSDKHTLNYITPDVSRKYFSILNK